VVRKESGFHVSSNHFVVEVSAVFNAAKALLDSRGRRSAAEPLNDCV
jgi:hypothetical protein